jgi:drug/metabolite transporter (DMT)-like permease
MDQANQYNPRLAALMITMAGVMFASMSACIKVISNDVPLEMVVFFRNVFGLLFLLVLLARAGNMRYQTQVFHLHFLRSIAGLAAMYAFFFAISVIHLSNAVLLSYTTPIFAPIIAAIWLKERFTLRLRIAITLGFFGIILIIQPGTASVSWGAVIGLMSGFSAAIAMVAIRRMSRTEPPMRVVFYYSVICTLVSTIPLTWSWQMPNLDQMMWVVAVGIFATSGQVFLTRGYSYATAAEVGPFVYTAVIAATVYGLIFWQESPNVLSIIGICTVIYACIIAMKSSTKNSSRVDTK